MAIRFIIELSKDSEIANMSVITDNKDLALSKAEAEYPGWTIDSIQEASLDV